MVMIRTCTQLRMQLFLVYILTFSVHEEGHKPEIMKLSALGGIIICAVGIKPTDRVPARCFGGVLV